MAQPARRCPSSSSTTPAPDGAPFTSSLGTSLERVSSSASSAGVAEVRAWTRRLPSLLDVAPTDNLSSTLDEDEDSGRAVAAVSSPSLCAVSSTSRARSADVTASPLRFLTLTAFLFLEDASCCCPRRGSLLSFAFSSSSKSSFATSSAIKRACRSRSSTRLRRLSSSGLTPIVGRPPWLPLPGLPLRATDPEMEANRPGWAGEGGGSTDVTPRRADHGGSSSCRQLRSAEGSRAPAPSEEGTAEFA
eukprot:scaffold87493_cov25-Tisochrysis_lutea.AAC.9